MIECHKKAILKAVENSKAPSRITIHGFGIHFFWRNWWVIDCSNIAYLYWSNSYYDCNEKHSFFFRERKSNRPSNPCEEISFHILSLPFSLSQSGQHILVNLSHKKVKSNCYWISEELKKWHASFYCLVIIRLFQSASVSCDGGLSTVLKYCLINSKYYYK